MVFVVWVCIMFIVWLPVDVYSQHSYIIFGSSCVFVPLLIYTGITVTVSQFWVISLFLRTLFFLLSFARDQCLWFSQYAFSFLFSFVLLEKAGLGFNIIFSLPPATHISHMHTFDGAVDHVCRGTHGWHICMVLCWERGLTIHLFCFIFIRLSLFFISYLLSFLS